MTFTSPWTARAALLLTFLGGASGASCSSPTPENGTNTNWQCQTADDCAGKAPYSGCATASCNAGHCYCVDGDGRPRDSGISDSAKPSGDEAGIFDPVAARCRQPQVVGQCNAAFPRFYYDAVSGSCESFVYGGCGGNENNFETLGECQAACGLGVVCDRCDTDSGPCTPTTDCPACPSVEGLATAIGKPCAAPGLQCQHDTSACRCTGPMGSAVWECRIRPI